MSNPFKNHGVRRIRAVPRHNTSSAMQMKIILVIGSAFLLLILSNYVDQNHDSSFVDQLELLLPVDHTTSANINSNENNDVGYSDWCAKIELERRSLHPDLHIIYPCESDILPLLPNNKRYKSAIVTFLTAGVDEGKGSRTVFTGKEYINGALALGASLSTHLTRRDTLRLLLVRDGFTLPQHEKDQLESVGWIIGKSPMVEIESKYVPRFARYKTTYTKIAALGLSEFECVLLMDADTLVVGNIDELLSCNVFEKKSDDEEYHVAGTLDYYHKQWFHFNTGSILWNTNVNEMNRVYGLTKDESFMKRFQSDQIFLNEVYPYRTDVKKNLELLEGGPNDTSNRDLWGKVVNLGWSYNAQTHVEVQLPEFWHKHKDEVKIIHYTEKKGWQCPERHGDVLSEAEMNKLNNCENKDRDDMCFCSVGNLWWDALRKGEAMAKHYED